MIVVCGEALIDLTHRATDPPRAYEAHGGGGPMNTAVALGRLGVPVRFLGRLAEDGFGRQLREHLVHSRVDLDLVTATTDPTTLAVATLDEAGKASYGFYTAATSAAGLTAADLPPTWRAGVDAIHVGTLGLVLEPSASTIEALLTELAGTMVIGLDPNVRPALIADLDAYRARIERLVALADLVKVSDDDLVALYPDRSPASVAAEWAECGPALVALTKGSDGVTAHTPVGVIEVASRPVEVFDTIGAGDSFNAGLLCALHDDAMLAPDRVRQLSRDEWTAAVSFAAAVAAVTCSHAGADPPWRHELGR